MPETNDAAKRPPYSALFFAFSKVDGVKEGFSTIGRVGDKYWLFSSGIDGIPGTKDDFYPEIEIEDSSRVGLVRKP
ncbi:MAG: hypothetical protein JST68_15925 [Bacteroidetes bacterium]|nr:hypothetical protein [Bacteroidota bacterium]